MLNLLNTITGIILYMLCTISIHRNSMETKTIALDREAYDLLWQHKREKESFSDVVKRLAGIHRPLSEFAGIWKKMSRDEIRKIEATIRRGRELEQKRMSALMRGLG